MPWKNFDNLATLPRIHTVERCHSIVTEKYCISL